ncbi:methylated-DNA--[protein]-cysteine S-methyltransferase [Polaromonas sp. JS666]|uniref:methylated-DNA--[protein]-cysteine S-methyltransferase n=1 Tax=Polaromonas sp. (strain JS666 / ATCC BAA-500) TaxID=296591 RepID=UPI00004647AD|nr:methylated-DNA--[protein]-cysteine S-methyltransferase [Polaromonas sp. JS666]ABE44476.1 methylated-DNA--protein-cysteine methyltransferase [Polaromonas sp. JS666]
MSTEGFALFDTPLGHCGIAWGDRGLVGVLLPEHSLAQTRARMKRLYPQMHEMPPVPEAQAAITRITALLNGERDDLSDIALDMSEVPPFHQRVYEVARAIPPGRTLTYGEVAARIGEPGAARAVGQALGHNPFAPVVPCHRVLAVGARSGGFSAGGGVATKLRMLQIEGAQIGDAPGLFDGDGPLQQVRNSPDTLADKPRMGQQRK